MEDFTSSFAAYGRHLASAFGGQIEEWRSVLLCNPGLAWRSRNTVVPLGPLDTQASDELAERVVEFYGARDRFVIWATLPLALDPKDFWLAESNLVMTRQSDETLSPMEVPDLTIEEVRDDAGARLFDEMRQTADKFPPPYDASPGRFFDARVLSPNHRLWVGYLDGVAVATCASFVHGDVNLIKNVSTAKEYVGRGIGTAMSVHAIKSSDKRPILDSSQAGAPVYRKLGFQEVGRVDFWLMT